MATSEILEDPICPSTDNPDLKTWTGILPYMEYGKKYRYLLELQMGKGKNSRLSVQTPTLVWGGLE